MVRQTRGAMPMCSFIPKCRRFSFFVRCISGSRVLLSFLVDEGAETMLTPILDKRGEGVPKSGVA